MIRKQRNETEGSRMPTLKNVLLAFLVASAVVGTALGQDADEDASSGFILEEVVVTSQRRVENLQQVPISATAIDGADLDAKAVDNFFDLEFATPSLSINQTGQTQSVNIRGIGLASDDPAATAGVSLYVDGLFQPPIVNSNQFYDIANIEVSRGPQGTFVGTNSTGGAIFINSRSPDLNKFGGYAQIDVGNYSTINFEGALNAPVTETFGFRVAGFTNNRDSYYHDIGPFNNDAGKLEEYGGRIGVLWEPGPFSALLKLSTNDMDDGGYARRPQLGSAYEMGREGDIYTLSYDTDVSHNEKADIHSLELKYELPNGVLVRSLSGYQLKRNYSVDDEDASQLPWYLGGEYVMYDYVAREKVLSEEINIISPTDGPFDWILGGYLQKNDIYLFLRYDEAGFPSKLLIENNKTTTGLFAHFNYQMTDALEIQFGGRYSTYEVDGDGYFNIGEGIPGFPPGGLDVADISGDYDDNKPTGKVALNWTFNPDNLIYGFVARGYKPGGYNSETSTFKPETILHYEAGWKSTSLFDGRLRTQFSLFYMDYTNFQTDILDPTTGQSGISNIGEGNIKGGEAQIDGVFGKFAFNTAVSYLDSELDSIPIINRRTIPFEPSYGPQCPPGESSNPPFCYDFTPYIIDSGGGPNMYAPEWSYNVGAEYTFLLPGDMTLTPRVNYSFVDKQWIYLAYTPVRDMIDSYSTVSALLTLRFGKWRVEARGTNLTEEEYISGKAYEYEFYGPPREYGLRVGVEF